MMPGFSLNWRRTSSTIEQEADDDVWVRQGEDGIDALKIGKLVGVGGEEFEVFGIGREQHERA
jgi:hypothetical protein